MRGLKSELPPLTGNPISDRLIAVLLFASSLLLAVGYLATIDYEPNYKPYWFGASAMIASGHFARTWSLNTM